MEQKVYTLLVTGNNLDKMAELIREASNDIQDSVNDKSLIDGDNSCYFINY